MDTVPTLRCASYRTGKDGLPEVTAEGVLSVPSLLALRQIRHHMKNTLQRIIAQIEFSNLRETREGVLLADDVQRRILLTAQISDALFGFTQAPARLTDRLEWLGKAVINLLGDDTQMLVLLVDVADEPAEPAASVIAHVTHEMLINAVKHGMRQRLLGRIEVTVRTRLDRCLVLEVRDDGWGPDTIQQPGEGYAILADLADFYGATVSLERSGQWTAARMSIPSPSAVAVHERDVPPVAADATEGPDQPI